MLSISRKERGGNDNRFIRTSNQKRILSLALHLVSGRFENCAVFCRRRDLSEIHKFYIPGGFPKGWTSSFNISQLLEGLPTR